MVVVVVLVMVEDGGGGGGLVDWWTVPLSGVVYGGLLARDAAE